MSVPKAGRWRWGLSLHGSLTRSTARRPADSWSPRPSLGRWVVVTASERPLLKSVCGGACPSSTRGAGDSPKASPRTGLLTEMGGHAGRVPRSVDALLLGCRAAQCVRRPLVCVCVCVSGELTLTNRSQQCLRRQPITSFTAAQVSRPSAIRGCAREARPSAPLWRAPRQGGDVSAWTSLLRELPVQFSFLLLICLSA